MTVLATLRPDNYDLSLFVHVLGATALVGALTATLILAGSSAQAQVTFRTLLWAAVPAWVVMRVGAELIVSKPAYDDEDTWIGIGYMTSELSALLIIAATIVAGLAARRGGRTSKPVTALIALTVLLALVAIWAMTAKPGL